MHTHSSAALHKTHAMIIHISIWLLWHVGALLRLQCAVLHQHCTHQCTTTDAFVLSAITPLMLSWGIFSVHLLTLKSHLEIARFKDIYMDNTVIQRVSQRFLQLKIWIVIKVHCPYSSSRGCKFRLLFHCLIIVTVCSVLYRDYPYSFILKKFITLQSRAVYICDPSKMLNRGGQVY